MKVFDAALAAAVLIVLIWGARANYLRGRDRERKWGRGSLLVSVVVSILAFPAFQFFIVRRVAEWGGLAGLAQGLVASAIFLNLFFSAHFMGVLSKDSPAPRPADDPSDQAHA